MRELLEEMGRATGDDPGFWPAVEAAAESLALTPFLERPVNEGLSGGEKKRSEMLQLLALRPRAAVLDEIDSGLDIDAVREVAAAVETMRSPELGVLLITHYSRILRYMALDRVHVMAAGRVIRSGGMDLAGRAGVRGLRSHTRARPGWRRRLPATATSCAGCRGRLRLRDAPPGPGPAWPRGGRRT